MTDVAKDDMIRVPTRLNQGWWGFREEHGDGDIGFFALARWAPEVSTDKMEGEIILI